MAEGVTHAEILYKLGAIEAKVDQNTKGWDEPVKRIEDLLKRLEKNFDQDVKAIKDQQTDQLIKIEKLESDIAAWKVRLSTVFGVVTLVWVILGDSVRQLLDKVIF